MSNIFRFQLLKFVAFQFTMKTVILTRFVSHMTFNRCKIFARLIDNDSKSQSYTVFYTVLTP